MNLKSDFFIRKQKNIPEWIWMLVFVIIFSILIYSFALREEESGYINIPVKKEIVKEEISFDEVKIGVKQKARITCYNWTGNKMANGEYPKEGYIATSDRTIKLGTKIEIEGIKYEVGDRTAKWVHDKFEYQTIDIYKDNCNLNFGVKINEIIVYK